MSVTPQVNIRIPLEAHELIRRLGELIRARPDMVPALERSVCDLESLAQSLAPNAPIGPTGVIDVLGDHGRRLLALESMVEELGRVTAAPPAPRPPEALNPRPKSTLAQMRRKANLRAP